MLTCGAERVLARKLPHAGDELCEPADEEGHADDDIRDEDAARLDIVHRQDKGRRREAEQTTAESDQKSETAGVGMTGVEDEDVQRTGVAQFTVVLLLAATEDGRWGVGGELGGGLLEVGHGWQVGCCIELEEDDWCSGEVGEEQRTQARSWETSPARVF